MRSNWLGVSPSMTSGYEYSLTPFNNYCLSIHQGLQSEILFSVASSQEDTRN